MSGEYRRRFGYSAPAQRTPFEREQARRQMAEARARAADEWSKQPINPMRPRRIFCAKCGRDGRERGHCDCWTPPPGVRPAYEPWSFRLRGKERE